MSAAVLQEIADVVRATCGLVVDPARRDVLAGVVGDRCERLGVEGPVGYLQLVRIDPAELQQLIENLTIGETYFARIPPQMQALRELVLPSLLARGDRRIRIWCAGCSTGEEPYTIAMLLAKLLPPDGATSDIRVIGSDIHAAALAVAREGRYGQRAVSLLTDHDLQRFFRRDGNGWRVGPELKRFVEFRQHNLTVDPPPVSRLDLILCRNVLIYFDRRVMLDVIDGMHSALAPGGWLLLGHSETLWRLYDGFELVRHGDAFLYRRPLETVPVPRARPLGSLGPPDPSGTLDPSGTPLAAPPRPSAPVRPASDPTAEILNALSAGAYVAAADLAAAQLADQPLSAQLHYLHGLALVETGLDSQALLALRRAAYLDPASGVAQFLLAVVLGRLGHRAEAARAYGAAAQALANRGPAETVSELGGRRVDDLADMCRQLAGAAWLASSRADAN